MIKKVSIICRDGLQKWKVMQEGIEFHPDGVWEDGDPSPELATWSFEGPLYRLTFHRFHSVQTWD